MLITLEYIFLHCLLVIAMFYSGVMLDKCKSNQYWLVSFFPILFFTIEEGCRWGRFGDWCHYHSQYVTNNLDSYELGFRYWWKLCLELDLHYCVVMCMCALLYMYSILFFVKPYRGAIKWILPIIVAYTGLDFDQFIRWYVAVSFVLIFYRLLLDKQYWASSIFFVLVCLTHLGTSLYLILLLVCDKYKISFTPIRVVFLSVILILVFDSGWMKVLVAPVEFLFSIMDNRFNNYDIEGWLTGSAQFADLERKSSLFYIVSMIPLYSSLFGLYSLRATVHSKYEISSIYSLMSISVFVLSLSSGLEFLSRYSELFFIFISIALSYNIAFLYKNSNAPLLYKQMLLGICCLFVCYKVYLFVRPLEHVEIMTYWWNATDSPKVIFRYFRH